MAIEHNVIVDAERHEPKGASTAAVGSVYVSDGATSGSWAFVPMTLHTTITDISTAAGSVVYIPLPFEGTVTSIYSCISGAIGTADATLTAKINTTAITTGAITVATAGSAAGVVDTVTPTGANTFTAGQYLTIETDGASTNTVSAAITFYVTRTS